MSRWTWDGPYVHCVHVSASICMWIRIYYFACLLTCLMQKNHALYCTFMKPRFAFTHIDLMDKYTHKTHTCTLILSLNMGWGENKITLLHYSLYMLSFKNNQDGKCCLIWPHISHILKVSFFTSRLSCTLSMLKNITERGHNSHLIADKWVCQVLLCSQWLASKLGIKFSQQ